ncbi:MAG: hypothetical protein ACRDE5_18455, partial [Ginsengibacter sp.]
MYSSEVNKYIKQELSKFLKPFGYKYVKELYGFVRHTNSGFFDLGTPIVNYNPLFKISFVFAIRINVVEEIYIPFSRTMSGYEQFSSTITIRYAYFKKQNDFYYHLYNMEELEIALKDFKSVFIESVTPFFEKYSNTDSVGELIKNNEIMKIDSSQTPDNYLYWLIIAKLCKLSNLKELLDLY